MSRRTVIVGAGSGGGVLAARLSEHPDEEIIVVEAGPDYPDPATIPNDLLDATRVSITDHDWGLSAYFVEPADERVPQHYPRAKVVGGCSCANLANADRASVSDLEAWVCAGNHEWSYESALPYFRRSEKDLDFGEHFSHGSSGPIPIVRAKPDDLSPAGRSMQEALLARGFTECDDFNRPGATGIGPIPKNLVDGRRASTLLTYLLEARGRPNLSILGHTLCRRVLFDGNRAVGVEVETADGQIRELEADRVVLAAGAVHTPQILTLSGVGPRRTLERLDVPQVIISEGVGHKLSDHVSLPTTALLRRPTDRLGVRNHLKYTYPGSDLVDDLLMSVWVFEPKERFPDMDTGGRKAMTLGTLLSRPRSLGWLTVTSPDIHQQPELHMNYLGDPFDVERAMYGVRFARELITSPPLADDIDEILSPSAEVLANDAELTRWMRQVALTVYHITATCSMGPDHDRYAVVDQRLAVRGAEQLWIADASVLPHVPTAMTNLTVYMVGERLAEWLTADEPVLS